MIVSRRAVVSAVHHLPGADLVYLNNAKVACSTIKKSLWLWADAQAGRSTYVDNPHQRGGSPFGAGMEPLLRGRAEISRATVFTVVRNPYVRVLSAYLDKIGRTQRDLAVWHPIARRFRLPAAAMPSFAEFLRLVVSEDPSVVDQHFAPQWVNVLAPLSSPDFIGRLERMDEVAAFLSRRGVTIDNHVPHVTKARERLREHYGPEEIALARDYYARDFELFGYSTDIEEIAPVAPPQPPVMRPLGLYLDVCDSALPGDVRRVRLEELKAAVPEIDERFVALENGLLPLHEIKRLSEFAIRGEIDSWKLMARTAEELIRHDMIADAFAALAAARKRMYGLG